VTTTRLKRRSLSKRILDRLAYWESMQQRQTSMLTTPAPAISITQEKSSSLASLGTFCSLPLAVLLLCLLFLSFFCLLLHAGASSSISFRLQPKASEEGGSRKGKEKAADECMAPRRKNEPSSLARSSSKTKSVSVAGQQEQKKGGLSSPSEDKESIKEDKKEDTTSAKRKFLTRSSSGSAMARRRLSMSLRSLTGEVSRSAGQQSRADPAAALAASGPVAAAANELNLSTSASGLGGINQIFYGKAELVKLLLELDEFD